MPITESLCRPFLPFQQTGAAASLQAALGDSLRVQQ